MLVIPGGYSKDTCDGITRRDVLRVGSSAMLGLSLPQMLRGNKARADETKYSGGPGFGKAKSVILCYLQGGPSHLDLWDPKENVPDNVKSIFKNINTKLPGVQFTENMPKLAQSQRQVHDDPLDELHAHRAVQSHGGHLPDAHRLHGRQGQPLRPVGTTQSEGLSELRLQHHQACIRRRCRCCRT